MKGVREMKNVYKQVVEIIPYTSFKKKMQLTKEIKGTGKITVFENYLLLERFELDI